MSEVPDIRELSFETNSHLRRICYRSGGERTQRFLNLGEMFKVPESNDRPFGILAANCFTDEMIGGVCRAAFDTASPLIVQVSESQVYYALGGEKGQHCGDLLGQYSERVVRTVSDLATEAGYMVPICLHLDHCQKNDKMAIAAAKAGFTSVELDYSAQPTNDRLNAATLNADHLKTMIPFLHNLGVSVEAEEGEIGDVASREAQTREQILEQVSRPEWVVPIVREANPDAVAVFIGSSHGEFKKKPAMFYQAVGDIRQALRDEGIDRPLVLHGGTGLTNTDFRRAVCEGVRKVNYASRWWTILEKAIGEDPRGAQILVKMDAAAPGKGARYAYSKFWGELYGDVSPDVFRKAEQEIYRHAVHLMSDGFCSAGKARLYRGFS